MSVGWFFAGLGFDDVLPRGKTERARKGDTPRRKSLKINFIVRG